MEEMIVWEPQDVGISGKVYSLERTKFMISNLRSKVVSPAHFGTNPP